MEELINATEDPNWKARWDAVNALGLLEDPRGIPALVQRALVDDNTHPRWRSLWALKAIDQLGTEAIPMFVLGLDSDTPVVVRNAAVALAFLAQSEGRAELIQGLKDPDSYRRWETVFSLKEVADISVIEALIPLLDVAVETEVRVRQETALTLGSIGTEKAQNALLVALREDISPHVRWRAALALLRIGDPSVVGKLQQAMSIEQDPQVLEFIQKAIDELRKPQS